MVELIKRNIHMDSIRCKAQTQMTLEDDVIISDSRPDAARLIMDRGNVVVEEVKVTDDHVSVKGRLPFMCSISRKGSRRTQEEATWPLWRGTFPLRK